MPSRALAISREFEQQVLIDESRLPQRLTRDEAARLDEALRLTEAIG